MTVTEFALFNLLPPYTTSSPEVIDLFTSVQAKQGAWAGYPVRFYQDTHTPSRVFLICGWKTVDEHMKWMSSEDNKQMLEKSQWQKLLTLEALTHLEVEYDEIPGDWKGIGYSALGNGDNVEPITVGSVTHRSYLAKDQTSPSKDLYHFAVFQDNVDEVGGKWDGIASALPLVPVKG